MNIDNFCEAFDGRIVGIWHYCKCGRLFYGSQHSWDWEVGEYDRISKQKNSVASKYDGVSVVSFEGNEYVNECDCWHERAKQIMGFLDAHAQEIGDYFRLERQRLLRLSERFPDDIKAAIELPPKFKPIEIERETVNTAPRNATWIMGYYADDKSTKIIHWAQDLSGEDQPPFQGWFNERFAQVDTPDGWRKLTRKEKRELEERLRG